MSKKPKIAILVVAIIVIGGAVYQALSNETHNSPIGNGGNTASNSHPSGWILVNGEYYDPNSITEYNSTTRLNAPETVVSSFYRYYLTEIYGRNYLDETPDTK